MDDSAFADSAFADSAFANCIINMYGKITGDVASPPPLPREEVAGRLDDLELALGEDGVKGRRIEDRTELQNEQETVKVIGNKP